MSYKSGCDISGEVVMTKIQCVMSDTGGVMWCLKSMWHQSHCLCHHPHCIDNITPLLCMKSHSPYVWHHLHYTRHHTSLYDLKPPFLGPHTHYIWHCVHCFCVITSIVLMIAHQLYLWDHIHYDSRHNIHGIRHDNHCICVITPTRWMISHPLNVWHHTHYMYNIIYPI